MKRNEGSFTVEAALIFPVVFLCIAALIYMAVILYQIAYMQSLADHAAARGADTWGNPKKVMETGSLSKADIGAGGLYWRVTGADRQNKIEAVTSYINNRMDKYSILKGQASVKTELEDLIAYKKLVVRIENKYEIPGGKFLKAFGLREYFTVNAESEAVINEPVEFLRNTDLILDTEKELEVQFPGIKKFGDNVRSVTEKIRNAAEKFFTSDR